MTLSGAQEIGREPRGRRFAKHQEMNVLHQDRIRRHHPSPPRREVSVSGCFRGPPFGLRDSVRLPLELSPTRVPLRHRRLELLPVRINFPERLGHPHAVLAALLVGQLLHQTADRFLVTVVRVMGERSAAWNRASRSNHCELFISASNSEDWHFQTSTDNDHSAVDRPPCTDP
jgi:hypothetical protein